MDANIQKHRDTVAAITSLRPGKQFYFANNVLTFIDATVVAPTQAEIDAEIARAKAVSDTEDARIVNVQADTTTADLLNRLRTSTLAQMSTWVDTQLSGTTVTQVRDQSRALHKRELAILMLLVKKLT